MNIGRGNHVVNACKAVTNGRMEL